MPMVKLRLQRAGRKYLPFYRIVAASVKNARNYKPLEKLGTYNPIPDRSGNKHVALKTERIMYWIMNGAQPTDTVAKLLARASLVPPAPHRRGALPDPENKWLKEALADGDEVDTNLVVGEDDGGGDGDDDEGGDGGGDGGDGGTDGGTDDGTDETDEGGAAAQTTLAAEPEAEQSPTTPPPP